MTAPLLVDLFCKAGGATEGYRRAGFRVLGIDIEPQPRYPGDAFVQADALEFLASASLAAVAAIHASPVCKRYSAATPARTRSRHPDQIAAVRRLLIAAGKPWVMENVPGAPLRPDLRLCGCMFGLPNLKRERWFETSWHAFDLRQPCDHREPVYSVCGGGPVKSHLRGDHRPTLADWKRSMGIAWMTGRELSQAIPPAYTEYIGRQLLDAIGHPEAVMSP